MYLCAQAGDDWVIWECALLLSWCCLNKCVKCQDFSKSIINSPHTVILIVSVESCSWIKLQQIWDFQRAESLQTRFLVSSSLPPPSLLARPYHCAVIHPECSLMQSGVLGTQLRIPGHHIQDSGLGESGYFCLQRRRDTKTSLAARARHNILSLDHWPCQDQRQSPVSLDSVFLPSNSSDQGSWPGCLWVTRGCLQVTISPWLYWASLSFTAVWFTTSVDNPSTNLHVLAKSNCDPATGLKVKRDETLYFDVS